MATETNSKVDDDSQAEDRFEKLRPVTTGLRSDLEITRQVYQGNPVYLVHDPVNFRNHRFSQEDYSVVSGLNGKRSLESVFQSLVERKEIDPAHENQFYVFVLKLHGLGLLNLPINNGAELFQRRVAGEKKASLGKYTGFLFFKIPLANPDAFLSRAMPSFRFLFQPWFVVVWMMCMCAAAVVVVTRASDVLEPLNGMLAAKNLPFLWLALIGLKIWHELGHGFACKYFGGRVPEMGALMLICTPAAYVDASAAWAFRTRWQRIVVMLGGMYFESMAAILAIFIWAFSSDPMIASCAFQVFIMASLITVLFNANPLMKFDGYFILSEILGIQNLRAKAQFELNSIWKKWFLGISSPVKNRSARERRTLILFGVAATIYKQILILTIAVMLTYRFPMVGLAIAFVHISLTVYNLVSKILKYLLFHRETAPVRGRAVFVGCAGFVGLPLILFLIPFPGGVQSTGVVAFENEEVVRARAAGFLTDVLVQPGDQVEKDRPLAHAENIDVSQAVLDRQLELQSSQLEVHQWQSDDINRVAALKPQIRQQQTELTAAIDQFAQLDFRSSISGRLAKVVSANDSGRFFNVGDEVAIVVDGPPVIKVWLREEELRTAQLQNGDPVEIKIYGQGGKSCTGTVERVEPASETKLEFLGVTQVAGGTVLVDPKSQTPYENLYEVLIRFDSKTDQVDGFWLQRGLKSSVRFHRRHESIGSWAVRRIHGFIKQVNAQG